MKSRTKSNTESEESKESKEKNKQKQHHHKGIKTFVISSKRVNVFSERVEVKFKLTQHCLAYYLKTLKQLAQSVPTKKGRKNKKQQQQQQQLQQQPKIQSENNEKKIENNNKHVKPLPVLQ